MISCIEPIQSLNKTDVKRGLEILILVLFFCPLCKGLNAYIWGYFSLYRCRCPIDRESLENYFQVDSERFSLAIQMSAVWVAKILIQGHILHFLKDGKFQILVYVYHSHDGLNFFITEIPFGGSKNLKNEIAF